MVPKMRFLPLSVRSVVKCSSLESNPKGHGSCSMTGDIVFFNPNDRGVKRTRGVWVTLTYDTKRCDFKDALWNVGVESKRFMVYVSKKFDKVSCCRVSASFENGHPHIRSFLKRWLFVGII
jgi:hypothetical protein